VRIFQGQELVATHARSFEPHARVIDPPLARSAKLVERDLLRRVFDREGLERDRVIATTCCSALAPSRPAASSPWSSRPAAGAHRAIRASLTNDPRYGLVQYLGAMGAEVVVADSPLAADPVARRAGSGPRRLRHPGHLVAAQAQAAVAITAQRAN
jgi:hypothetical protein